MATPVLRDKSHTAVLIMDYQHDIVSGMAAHHPGLLGPGCRRPQRRPPRGITGHLCDRLLFGRALRRSVTAIPSSGVSKRRDGSAPGPQALRFIPTSPRSRRRCLSPNVVWGPLPATNLESVLRAQQVTSLVLLGIATSGVVLSTVRWAADADYELIVIEDGCADADEEVQRVLMHKVFPRQATVVQAQEFLQALAPVAEKP